MYRYLSEVGLAMEAAMSRTRRNRHKATAPISKRECMCVCACVWGRSDEQDTLA